MRAGRRVRAAPVALLALESWAPFEYTALLCAGSTLRALAIGNGHPVLVGRSDDKHVEFTPGYHGRVGSVPLQFSDDEVPWLPDR
jgi:hypothetical protein